MADMRKPLFDLAQVDMQAELNSYVPGSGMAHRTLFPLKYTPSLDIKSLEGNEGIPVSADVVAFNAKAPQKTRKTIGKWSGQVAKVSVSREKDETQIKEYQMWSSYARTSGNPNVAQQLVDLVYEDVEFCYNGINGVNEELALKVGSKASVVLNKMNNNDVVTTEEINFNVPAKHKVGVAAKWSAGGSAGDPLKDIIDGQKAIQKEGLSRPMYAIMEQAAFDNLVLFDKTVKRVAPIVLNATGLASSDTLSLEQINTYLRSKGYPQIIVLDSYAKHEDRGGNQDVYKPWAENVVVLSPTPQLGWTWWSDVPQVSDTDAMQVYREHIKITRYSELNPMQEVTLAEAYIMPALTNRASLYYINTENTSWNNGDK